LSRSQVNKRALNIIKAQSTIDSLCFPETLNRVIVVNAPSFFSMTWRIIRSWIDSRTASKIEIFTSTKKAHKRLLEIVDKNELPSDYGGRGVSTVYSLEKNRLLQENKALTRQISQLMSLGSKSYFKIQLHENEAIDYSIFTRCLIGAEFKISIEGKNDENIILIKHGGNGIDEEKPTRVDCNKKIFGPCTIGIQIKCIGNAKPTKYFLFIGKIFDRDVLMESDDSTIGNAANNFDFCQQSCNVDTKRSFKKEKEIPVSRKIVVPRAMKSESDMHHRLKRNRSTKDNLALTQDKSSRSHESLLVRTQSSVEELQISEHERFTSDASNDLLSRESSRKFLDIMKPYPKQQYYVVDEENINSSNWVCGWKSCW